MQQQGTKRKQQPVQYVAPLYRPFVQPRQVVQSRPYMQSGAFATGSEIKCVDIPDSTYGFTRPAGGGSIFLVNPIQAGTGFFNRVGSRVEMKSLHIRGFLYFASTSIQDQARMIIIYDRQPTGALPAISAILQNRDQAGAATSPGSAEINLDNRDRFLIIRDHQVSIPSCTVAAGVLTNGPQWVDSPQVNLFIKLKGLTTHFNSTANPLTITNVATGALYCLFISDTQDSTFGFNGNFRLRYNDK